MKIIKVKKNGKLIKIERYTFTEWMKKFRPDGIGRISIGVPGNMDTIEFTEVVCDYCNDEITPKVECKVCNGTEYTYMCEDEEKNVRCKACKGTGKTDSVVYVVDNYSICEKCFNEEYRPYNSVKADLEAQDTL